MNFENKAEAYDYLDKYVKLISTGNIYNLTYEQQEKIMENNLNAKYLLTFEQWKAKGASIIKGTHALIKLPSGEYLFDLSQTNYKQYVDEDFPRFEYDQDNITNNEFYRFIRHFENEYYKNNINTDEKNDDLEQLLVASLLQRFADVDDIELQRVVYNPEDIDLEDYSNINKTIFNYIKSVYNDNREKDVIKFSDIVKSLNLSEELEKGEENESNRSEMESINERENGISQGPISSEVSGDEGQRIFNEPLAGNRRAIRGDSEQNIQSPINQMGEGQQEENSRSVFAKTTRSEKSNRDANTRNNEGTSDLFANVVSENDATASFFNVENHSQLSLFEAINEIEKEELHQEQVKSLTNELIYTELDINDFVDNVESDIDVVLKRGSSVEEGKYRIYDLLVNHKDLNMASKAKLLAKEYGTGGRSAYGEEEKRNINFVDYSSKGIKITYNDNSTLNVKWNEVAKNLNKLIKEGNYLSDEEFEDYQDYQRRKPYNHLFPNEEYFDYVSPKTPIYPFEKTYKLINKDDQEIILSTHYDGYVEEEESYNLCYQYKYKNENGEIMSLSGTIGIDEDDEPDLQLLIDLLNKFEQRISFDIDVEKITTYNGEFDSLDEDEEDNTFDSEESKQGQADRQEFVETLRKETINDNTYQIKSGDTLIAEISNVDDEKELEATNYHIDDLKVGFGKPRERYQNNINAIKLLRQLEEEDRPATKEEQDVLAKYVGWGGLADAFDKDKWPNEYAELKELLTDSEYDNALSSVNTAYYTQPAVVDTIYKALDKFGFKKGNILEPSCGIGNFFGRMPEEMQKNSSLYGVEIDEISAHIAQKLYPNALIEHTGYEKADFEDNFFDVAIGNVPFGNLTINDQKYNKHNFLIHDYFFAKTIDKVRAGGVIALISSKGTLDKMNSKAREYIAKRCDLIGAIRLPKETFKGNAGTEAVSDIIFLSKRESPAITMPNWVNSTNKNFMFIDYFDKYMSKEELENELIDIVINNKVKEFNNIEQYLSKEAEKIDTYYYPRSLDRSYYYNREEVKNHWKAEWSNYGGFVGKKYNPKYYWWDSNILELYKWYKENPEEVIKIVAESGKFKTDKDRKEGKTSYTEREYELAAQYLESGEGSIEEHFKNVFINKRVQMFEEIINSQNVVKDEKDQIVKEGMKMQPVNTYFAENKDMIIGDMTINSAQFGYDTSVSLANEEDLSKELDDKLNNLNYSYKEAVNETAKSNANVIQADPRIANYSYGYKEGKLYYRTGGTMEEITKADADFGLIKELITLRDVAKNVIDIQLNECSDEELKQAQEELNNEYDAFVKKHGYIYKNDKSIRKITAKDSSLTIVSALEDYDAENEVFNGKMPIFTERTVHNQESTISHCDTAYEALVVSLQSKVRVDLDYMQELTGKSKEELLSDLQGSIYRDYKSEQEVYLPADELLSGNVKEKCKEAQYIYNELMSRKVSEQTDIYDERLKAIQTDIEALQNVFPHDIPEDLIEMPLSATWIPAAVYQQFMEEVLLPDNLPYYGARATVYYSDIAHEFGIENKTKTSQGVVDLNTTLLTEVYGLNIAGHGALDILENTLNMGSEKVYDHFKDPETNKTISILNKEKTLLAKMKQEELKNAFQNWLQDENTMFKENYHSEPIQVRKYLAQIYNDKFNAIVDRKYDTNLVKPVGMAILKDAKGNTKELYPHQKEVIAKALFGGNTGIFHSVGAGKTLSMITIAMESKRLGLCNKSLFVCPKSIVGQWAKEFLANYPQANILVADEESFSKENRARFISKIATGNYDAVIISNEQFGKLKLSDEREEAYMQEDIDKIKAFVNENKNSRDGKKRFSVKKAQQRIENLTKALEKRHTMKKDDYIEFEQLGIDKLFIDESHNYKNLAFETSLSRVKGIGDSDSKRSNDLYYKTKYLNELTGSKGVIFASGTPVSNSLSELYTIQRYLQPDALRVMGVEAFDAWASVFAKIEDEKQIDYTGNKYTEKALIKSFHNIPELMAMFRQIADIRTKEDMKEFLNLPEVSKLNIDVPRTDEQSEYLDEINKRVDVITHNQIDRHIDNLLKVTTDGRKLALDQRIVGQPKPEGELTKTDYVVENVYKEYVNSNDTKGTQFIFSDMSTPKKDKFNVYNDIKELLVKKGIPEKEIAFIHDTATDKEKLRLFKQLNTGEIRVVIGSTEKLGTGVNAQQKAVALHHIDVPWRPSDIEQREGRVVRSGNENKHVNIYRYVTKDTFDAYSWQTIENKAKFINQVMKSSNQIRELEDLDNTELDAAQLKALSTGNPLLKEHLDLENDIKALKIKKSNYIKTITDLKNKINNTLPRDIKQLQDTISNISADLSQYEKVIPEKVINDNGKEEYKLNITINGKTYSNYKEAGEALQEAQKKLHYPQDKLSLDNKGKLIGNYLGFDLRVACDPEVYGGYCYVLGNKNTMVIDSLREPSNLTRKIVNSLDNLSKDLKEKQDKLSVLEKDLKTSKERVKRPFEEDAELKQKQKRYDEITEALKMKENNEYSATNDEIDETLLVDEEYSEEDEKGYSK